MTKEYLLSIGCFIDNSFLDKYLLLVNNKDVCEGYFEKHHIIPKCYFLLNNLEIDNSENNIVKLSKFNHILAHYYLINFTKSSLFRDKLCLAYHTMKKCYKPKNEMELKSLEELYDNFSSYWKNRKRTDKNKHNCSVAQLNRTKEHQDKISQSNRNKKRSGETKLKMSLARKGKSPANKGVPCSEETKEKLRIANLGKKQSENTKLKRSTSMSKLKWYNNGIIQMRVDCCPEGWVKGRLPNQLSDEAKSKCSQKGKKWFNNGKINTMSFSCPEGFISGRLKNNKDLEE